MNAAQIYRDIFLSMIDRQDSHDHFACWMELDANKLDCLKFLNKYTLTYGSLDFKVNGRRSSSGVSLDKIQNKHFSSQYIFEIKLIKSNINQGHDFIVCNNWDTILRYENNIKKTIENIFLTDSQSYFDINSSDSKYKNYLTMSSLYSFIDFLSKESNADKDCIFYNRSYRFKIKACEDDLSYSIDKESLDRFTHPDMYREAIINIMCKEVTAFVKNEVEENRFGYLIRNINPLVTNINHSYQSYVEDYTFDKVRKEYSEKRTEYIKKLNDTFDSVVTKMFAIPAGIWFATAQMTPVTEGASYIFTKNFFVLITVISMIILMVLNIFSQQSTTKQMRAEYTEVFDNLGEKFLEESIRINQAKTEVDTRFCKIQSYAATSIVICIALALYVAILFYQSLS